MVFFERPFVKFERLLLTSMQTFPKSHRVFREAMRVIEGLIARLGIAGELLAFFWQHKWCWTTPMLLALLLVAALVIFAQSSAIAPFIYTLF